MSHWTPGGTKKARPLDETLPAGGASSGSFEPDGGEVAGSAPKRAAPRVGAQSPARQLGVRQLVPELEERGAPHLLQFGDQGGVRLAPPAERVRARHLRS